MFTSFVSHTVFVFILFVSGFDCVIVWWLIHAAAEIQFSDVRVSLNESENNLFSEKNKTETVSLAAVLYRGFTLWLQLLCLLLSVCSS